MSAQASTFNDAVPANAPVRTTYLTHDNGGRPFTVDVKIVEPKTFEFSYCRADISVWRNIYRWKQEAYERTGEVLLSYQHVKVWVGISPLTNATRFGGGAGPDFEGNCVLIQPDESVNTYVLVGEEIMEFDTTAPIVTFVSPVGNNDVPYCYAIDDDKIYYLPIERVVLSKCGEYSTDPDVFDPYDFYYNHSGTYPGKMETIWFSEDDDTSNNGAPEEYRIGTSSWSKQRNKDKCTFWRYNDDETVKAFMTLDEVEAIVKASIDAKGSSTPFVHRIICRRQFLTDDQ